MAVHRSGFLKDKLGEVLPAHMTSSRRKVEFERRVLTKHAEISDLNMEENKVEREIGVVTCHESGHASSCLSVTVHGLMVTQS